jgi:hypothetical protein
VQAAIQVEQQNGITEEAAMLNVLPIAIVPLFS